MLLLGYGPSVVCMVSLCLAMIVDSAIGGLKIVSIVLFVVYDIYCCLFMLG